MKKSLLIMGLAVTLFSCNDKGAATTAEFKSAYVDTHKLMDEYDELKDLENKAKVKEEVLGKELQEKGKQLQLDAASFQKEAAAKGPQWAQLRSQDLQRREQELRVMQQTFQEQFASEFGVQRDTIVSQMRKFIKDYGKKKGYDYVFGTGDAASILYAKEGYDITAEVLKELNSTYKGKDDKVEPAKVEPAKKEEEKK